MPIKLAAILVCGLIAFLTFVAFVTEVPAIYIVFGMGTFTIISGGTLYLIQRYGANLGFDLGSNPDLARMPTQGKARMIRKIYVIAALGLFCLGIRDAIAPSGDKGFGMSGLLAAICLVFLALRDRRTTDEARLNLLPKASGRSAIAPFGSPKTTIVAITVLACLLVLGDIRFIMFPKQPTDMWVGIGQMILWIPIFAYLAYQEIRRLRAERTKNKEGIDA